MFYYINIRRYISLPSIIYQLPASIIRRKCSSLRCRPVSTFSVLILLYISPPTYTAPFSLYTLTVTDLILLVLRILRRDLSELTSSIEPVDLYNEGQPNYVINLVRGFVDLQERYVPTYLRTLRTQALLWGGVMYLRPRSLLDSFSSSQ